MKKLTSFTAHVTAEGQRISFTYSEIDPDGKLINQNERENFVVMDKELQSNIDAINDYIYQTRLSDEG